MNKIINCFVFILLALFVQAQQQPKQQENKATQFPSASIYANTKLTYRIIDAPGKTYGYDICADGRLMIHQSSVPALPGNEGFKTKAAAEKVAKKVIEKIGKGESPPTVSIDEMKQLGAISKQ